MYEYMLSYFFYVYEYDSLETESLDYGIHSCSERFMESVYSTTGTYNTKTNQYC
jgi:hypothetical protein